MKRVWVIWICGGIVALVIVGSITILVRGRTVSKPLRGTVNAWRMVSASQSIGENDLTEKKLQPVWFGPPRVSIPETLEEITNRLRRDPENRDLVAMAAIKASQERKWESALRFYRRWIELDPKEVNAHLGVVYALVNLHRASEALELLTLAQRGATGNKQQMHYYCAVEGDVYLFLALEAKHRSRESYETLLKKAQASYVKAQKAGDFSARATIGLLRIALEREQFAAAQKIIDNLYKKGVTNQREQALVAYYQGVVLERQGNLSKAREYYRAAINADPASFAIRM